MLVEATFLTTSLTRFSLEWALVVLNRAIAPSTAVNWVTQSGTRMDIRPLLSAATLMILARSLVTQPPQMKPIVTVATPPMAIP